MAFRKFLITTILVSIFLPGFSQKNGYKIQITISDVPDEMLYLVGNYGENQWIADSAAVNGKFTAVFKGEEALPSGIYIVQNKAQQSYLDLIIDQSRHFSIATSMDKLLKERVIKKSPENQLLFEVEKAAFLSVLLPTESSAIEQYADLSPQTLLSKFLKAVQPVKVPSSPELDSTQIHQYKVAYFFDGIDVNDARLLRVPMIPEKVFSYFTELLPQQPDTLIERITAFLDGIQTKEVFDYYLEKLFKEYAGYHTDYDLDAVAVYLYDRYCAKGLCSFITPDYERITWKKMERKRKLLPGQLVPFLEAYDREGKVIRTQDLESSYILLWFWEPDCETCMELTPVLLDFYSQFKHRLDFEVYAVALTEDEQAWTDFINRYHLDWINVSFVKGFPNYDVIDYFDIMTTPNLVLMDRNHTILTRQISFEHIRCLMEQHK